MATAPQNPSEPTRPPGVREVAEAAGVSIGTVSNVINDPDRVRDSTRAKVEQAMSSLGFVGSRAAAQLRSRRSQMIGVVVPDVGNPFWASVVRGIESICDRRDLSLLVCSTHQSAGRQLELLRALQGQGVDGLVIAPISEQAEDLRVFEDRPYGVVTLERRLPGSTAGWVDLDDVEGARLAMAHLLDLGHRRVTLVNGPEQVSWCADRHEGAVRAIQDAGLDPDEVLRTVVVHDLTVDEGRAAMRSAVAQERPQAVMCANDLLALGAMFALREEGLSVPEDVALVGYDDTVFAAALDPPLTTVFQPSFEMGVAAAKLLLCERQHGENVRFEPRLVVRASTVGRGGQVSDDDGRAPHVR